MSQFQNWETCSPKKENKNEREKGRMRERRGGESWVKEEALYHIVGEKFFYGFRAIRKSFCCKSIYSTNWRKFLPIQYALHFCMQLDGIRPSSLILSTVKDWE